jgi:hypothetical protein
VLENEGAELVDEFVAVTRRRVETRIRATELHILARVPFDPVKFIGKNWSILEQVGKRSGGNLNVGQIIRKDYLKFDELFISGEERLKRIKATPDDIQLDAEDFLALWQEKGQKTLRWLYETQGITWLSFWGTILQNPGGSRDVLCLYQDDDGSWSWHYGWVNDGNWDASDSSGVLASS